MPPTSGWRGRFAAAADGLCLLLLAAAALARRHARAIDGTIVVLGAAALVIDLAGGLSWQIGGRRFALASGAPVASAALLALVVRLGASIGTPQTGVLLARGRPDWPRDLAWPSRREWLWAALVFTATTALLLWQQLAAFASVPDLSDPLFSMWRLGWIAHQLPTDPRHLFDANIFAPDLRTLAYSDSMIVPALIAAPFLWLGAPGPVVYTSLVLLTFVTAGLGMYALVRAMTGHTPSGLLAGMVFAYDPFRFAHYGHLELLFTCWMPLALLAVVQALATGRLRAGVLAGVLIALQALSSLYYGAYFSASLPLVVVAWIWLAGWPRPRAIGALALGGAIAAVAALVVTGPYRATRETVGDRDHAAILEFSAIGDDYVTAYHTSARYHSRLPAARTSEHALFPGTVPIVLGAAALVPPIGVLAGPSALALAGAVDASLGLNGTVYSQLEKLSPFRAFRAPARFRAVAGLYLALLAGMGVARLARRFASGWPRRLVLGALGAALLADLQPTLRLEPVWRTAPALYQQVPERAVLVDLPIPSDGDPFWRDMIYMYYSTFHWRRLVNGSSGFSPARYIELGRMARTFPSDVSLDAFRFADAEYAVLHEQFYGDDFRRVVAAADAQPRLQFVATSSWQEGECRLYRIVR